MMDPVSIAASAASLVGLVTVVAKKISAFISCCQNVDESIAEFHSTISTLEAVITSIEKTFRSRRRYQAFERRHWEVINAILHSLRGCLYALNNAIPQTTSGGTGSVQAFMLQWRSDLITAKRAHIASYTQCLQISLTALVLSSQWDAQDRQGDLWNEIQQLSKDIKRVYREQKPLEHADPTASSSSAENEDIALEKEIAFRNLESWVSSTQNVTRAISHKARSTEQGSATQPSVAQWVQNDNDTEDMEAEGADDPAFYPESTSSVYELSVLELESEFDHDEGYGSMKYSSGDLEALIEEHRRTIDLEMNARLYTAAEEHLKRLIELLRQRGDERIEEVTDAEEMLARVLFEQRTKRGLGESLKLSKELLTRYNSRAEDDDPNRVRDRYRRVFTIKFTLATIYLELGLKREALHYALDALKDKQNNGATTAEIDDSYLQVASIHDRIGDHTMAVAMRNRMQNQPSIPIIATTDLLLWLSSQGFIPSRQRSSSNTYQSPLQLDYINTIHPLTRETPLQFAISREEDPSIIRTLLARGGNKEVTNKKGATPLLLAASTRNKKIVAALLESGADAEAIDDDGNSALHAVQTSVGGVQAAKLLIQACPYHILNAQDKRGRTPLHYAAACGNEPMVQVLLTQQPLIDVNAKDCAHDTPLHLAIYDRHAESLIALLIRNGANVLQRNIQGKDAVQAAKSVQPRMKSVVNFLERQRQIAVSTQAVRSPTFRRVSQTSQTSSIASSSSNYAYDLPEINQSRMSLPFSTRGSTKSVSR